MRAFDRDLIRGGHYGQRSCEPRKQAEHMAAPTNSANVKISLANSEPSTHGTCLVAYLVPIRGTVSTAYRWQSEADLEGKTGMCDYSLHAAASRPARTGDKLVISRFPYTFTRGFAAVDESNVAVCLCPGTEIAFDSEVQVEMPMLLRFLLHWFGWGRSVVGHKVARFRRVNMEVTATHHDAIELPDGRVILLTRLAVGQRATVLQLPIRLGGHATEKMLEYTA